MAKKEKPIKCPKCKKECEDLYCLGGQNIDEWFCLDCHKAKLKKLKIIENDDDLCYDWISGL